MRTLRRSSSLLAVTGLALAGLVAVASPAFAASLTVTTTVDTNPAFGPCATGTTVAPSPLSLRDALCVADNLGGANTVTVPSGLYVLAFGELQFGTQTGSSLTLQGAGSGSTIIEGQNQSRVLELDPGLVGGISTSVSGVTIRGGSDNTFGGAGVIGGSGNAPQGDSLTVTNSVITANTVVAAGTNNPGGGIQFVGGSLTITNSTISNNDSRNSPGSAVAYAAQGLAPGESFTMTNTTVSGNSSANTAGPSANSGALDLSGTPGTTMTVSGSTFTANTGLGSAGPVRGGAIRLQTGTLTVSDSVFAGNVVTGTGSGGGALEVAGGTATVVRSRIVGNSAPAGSGIEQSSGTATATSNWWGCNAGPGNAGCDSIAGTVTSSPRLQLSAPAVASITTNATTTVSADLAHDSTGASVGGVTVFGGTALAFGGVQPTGSTCSPASATVAAGAAASCTFTAGSTGGLGQVTATYDNQTITVPVEVDAPPVVTTDPADQTVAPGAIATFTAAASGYPTPTVQWQVSTDGLGWTDIGAATSTTLAFTAQPGLDGNRYRAVFTNSLDSATSASASLSVREGPAITSADHVTFTAGSAGTFTVTTTGTPAATITETGTLPSGMSFTDNGNGTATLAGTPTAGTGGVYPLTITAANGVVPDATQAFTLTVNEAPSFTSADHVGFVSVAANSFSVTTAGYPVSTIVESGALPSGVMFVDNGDGTADLYGVPDAGTSGTYPLTITAANGVLPDATQAFTLVVDTMPQTITFTSTPPANAVVGQTYGVTATGGVSGNPVTFSIAAGATGVCSISGATVHLDHAGSCVVQADQAGTSQYSAATATQTVPVGQAATATALALTPTSVTATVTAVAPGAGTPTGTVAFLVDGTTVGSATLTGGTATLAYAVPSGATRAVSAVYGGSADYTGSSASTARTDPSISAVVSSSTAKTRYGWYRSAVTVSFRCTTSGVPLTAPCPAAVTFTHSGAGQSVTRTVLASDGGSATVTVRGINIDRGLPSVAVSGVRNGAVYQGVAPAARCVGSDSLSGLLSCTLRKSVVGSRVYYSVTAVDRAGNSRRATGSYVVQQFFLSGAAYRNGAFQVTEGQSYLLVALTTRKVAPRFYAAAPAGRKPGPAGALLRAAGTQGGKYRWTLAVRIDRGLQRYALWDLGVKTGTVLQIVRFHPAR